MQWEKNLIRFLVDRERRFAGRWESTASAGGYQSVPASAEELMMSQYPVRRGVGETKTNYPTDFFIRDTKASPCSKNFFPFLHV